MTATPTPRRITGPLKTWYDMHEALAHEVTALADQATTTDGHAYAWGINNAGQVGDGTTTNRAVPTRVTLL